MTGLDLQPPGRLILYLPNKQKTGAAETAPAR